MLYLEHISFNFKNGLLIKDRNGGSLSLYHAAIKGLNRFLSYFLDLELFLLRVVGFIPFFLVRRFFYFLSGVKMGRRAYLHTGAQFFNPRGVEIGEGSIIGQNVFLDGRQKLKIGRFVDIASDVMIYNGEHDINSEGFDPILAPVKIGDYVFIGPRVIILPGVSIGKGAVVAAGAVVTKNVEDFSIVGGVPAQAIGERKLHEYKYNLGKTRLFQ